jgi:hypothetical protein
LFQSASLYTWGWRHKELLEDANKKGICAREWIDAALETAANFTVQGKAT